MSPIRIQHGQPKREKVWVPTDAEKKEKAIDRAVVRNVRNNRTLEWKEP